ncbi:MAG: hypothetical protein N3A61_03510, partial [Ignavibacteria bacterium]|nr:hypothetical protein [Ignavibacteria bacterium]
PTPYDFFFTFDDFTKENLSWYWKPWFFERGFPDLAIKDVKYENKKVKVLVRRNGNIPIPVSLTFKFKDKTEIKFYSSAKIWADGKDEKWVEQSVNQKPEKIILGNSKIPDSISENNEFNFE